MGYFRYAIHCFGYILFFLKKFFLIEVCLLYNVVLVSDVQQSDSVIHVYIFLFLLLITY